MRIHYIHLSMFRKIQIAGHTYEGIFVNDKMHGPGRKIGPNFYLEGNWVDDYLEGQGEVYLNDGTHYEGEFRRSKRHGHGKIYNANCNLEFEGHFANDLANGHGIMYTDMWKAEGEFVDGKAHGYLISTFIDGGVHRGMWQNDKPNGFGTYIKGSYSYKGEYVNSLKHGFGIESEDEIYEGYWHNDKKHGSGKIITKDGYSFIGVWDNDKVYKIVKFLDNNGDECTSTDFFCKCD